MATASLHRYLFLSAIATVLALSTTPATATFFPALREPPSPLVKGICTTNSAYIDYRLCTSILSTAEANAAQDLQALAVISFKLAGRTARATHAAFQAFIESPEAQKSPQLNQCQLNLGKTVTSFTQTLPGDMKGNLRAANVNVKANVNYCDECTKAMADSRIFAPSVNAGIQALKQFSLIGSEITNKMCKERGIKI